MFISNDKQTINFKWKGADMLSIQAQSCNCHREYTRSIKCIKLKADYRV